ncbi:MAG TPA: FlgD immunoglobulin-like domain containing protein [Candidatus Saccharimonadaceae bacterium]|jgi:hypothetical protein|nr:FlgD immunoglobulin-like domain containing protein [Candidatus Saccharimonadaceae bacterium]
MSRRLAASLALLAALALSSGAAHAVCTYSPLSQNSPVNIVGSPSLFSVSQTYNYWSAVAVRPQGGDDWDIQIYSAQAADPVCVTGQLAGSSRTSGVDFVIGDFNVNPLAVYWPRVTKFSGSNSAQVEWDSGPDLIETNNAVKHGSMAATDVIDCYDVYLTAGTTYTVTFQHAGAANLRVLLFRNALGGTFWSNRNGAEFEATTSTNYTAPSSGYYGVVVINDDGGAGSYDVGVGACSTPEMLSDKSSTPTLSGETYYACPQAQNFWTAVAVLGTSSDYDLEVSGVGSGADYPSCFTGPLAGSAYSTGFVDFVVGDFNFVTVPDTFYARPHLFLDQGTPGAVVEWDQTSLQIQANGPVVSGTMGAGQIVKVWDVKLVAGRSYLFSLAHSGSGSLSMMLFRNPAPGAFWAGRASTEFATSATASYTAPSSGFYGVVLVDDNNQAANFTISVGSCTAPFALTSGSETFAVDAEQYVSFNQTVPFWTAIGVRGVSLGSDWDIETYSTPGGGTYPTCLSGMLAQSTAGLGAVDFVVGDFNWNAPGTYYARSHLYQDQGFPHSETEWDSGSDQLFVGGSTVHRSTDPSDILEVWDVFLQSGHTYTFRLSTGGPANTQALLFRNPGGTYWAGRSAREWEITGGQQSYTAPSNGYYGLVVVNNDGGNGWYDIRVDEGTVSVDNVAPPSATALRMLSPNPAAGGTRIAFALHAAGRVAFDVLDMSGRRVSSIAEQSRDAGEFSVAWSGRSDSGAALPAGLYFVRMRVDGRPVGVQKLVLRD